MEVLAALISTQCETFYLPSDKCPVLLLNYNNVECIVETEGDRGLGISRTSGKDGGEGKKEGILPICTHTHLPMMADLSD